MKKCISLIFFVAVFNGLSGQGSFTDKRDGNVYKTITIDGLTWMAENLRFKSKSGAYYFDNDSNNISMYGVLYEWKSAIDVCPIGWHLPSGSEFRKLSDYFEQKDSWGTISSDPVSFGIQLGGMQDTEGTFAEMDESCYYWTSTEYDKDNSEYFSYMILNQNPVIDISRKEDIAEIVGTEKSNKYSVRCVKE